MNIEQEREMFEKKFPKPRHCVWTGNGYAVTKYGVWEASAYVDKFEGWRTRAALQEQSDSDSELLEWLVENVNRIDIDEGHRGWFVLERDTDIYLAEDCKTFQEALKQARKVIEGE